MLELRGVNVSYGPIQALKDVSLKVKDGEWLTIIGSKGAGKTTLLRTISGLMESQSGAVWYQGIDILHSSPEKIVAMGISQVLEGKRLFSRLTVLDNLHLGAYFYDNRKFKTEIKEQLERVYSLFPGLKKQAKQMAGAMSAGDQQTLAIGRALMARPRLLLLDEPSKGLTSQTAQEIFKVIRQLNDQGIAILLMEQNVPETLQIARYDYVLETGRIALAVNKKAAIRGLPHG